VKDMVKDMELRVIELRQAPVSINDPTGTGALDGANPLSGILGSILGESPEAQKARIEEATKEAKDVTNLIRRNKPVKADADASASTTSNGKRKVEFAETVEEIGNGKKARVEDADDS